MQVCKHWITTHAVCNWDRR